MTARTITTEQILAFGAYLTSEERRHATVEKYTRDIARFAAYAAGREITKSLILDYKEALSREYALTSANSILAALNTFFRYAGWQNLSVKQFKIQRSIFRPEEQELTEAEYVRLVEAAQKQGNERLALLLQTICATGIRVSELVYVTLEALKNGEVTVSCKGKSRKIIFVSALRKKLLKYAKAQSICSGQIFVTKRGKAIDRSNIWREMKALCAYAGISAKKVFPHNLRHVFAKVFYRLEKDIAKLADILGHSSINTTRIYIMSTGIEHRQKMEAMRLIL